MDRFVYLTQGLAVILAFIGVKMLLIDVWHVPIWLSLAVIAGTLGVHRGAARCGRTPKTSTPAVAICDVLVRAGRARGDVKAAAPPGSSPLTRPSRSARPRARRIVDVAADALRVAVVAAQRVEQRLRCGRPPGAGSCSGTPSAIDVPAALGRLEEVVGVGADVPRMTFAPPGESSTVATSPGVATVTAEERGHRRRGEQLDARRRRSRQLCSMRRSRTWIGVPSRPPSAVVLQEVQADAEARVVEADLGQDAGLGQRREPAVAACSTIQITVECASASGCQSQFCASRPPPPTTLHSSARAGEDLGAGVDRAQLVRVDLPAPGAIASDLLRPRAQSTRAPRRRVRAVASRRTSAGRRASVCCDRRRLRAPERFTALGCGVGSPERWTGNVMP